MSEYIISVKDDSKANHVLALLRDLSYIDISKREVQTPPIKKRPSEIITPIKIDNFIHYSREELNER